MLRGIPEATPGEIPGGKLMLESIPRDESPAEVSEGNHVGIPEIAMGGTREGTSAGILE